MPLMMAVMRRGVLKLLLHERCLLLVMIMLLLLMESGRMLMGRLRR
jgi:hypothetical protein